MPEPFDVAIIGAGVVGCAVARVLSHHDLKVALIDSAPDVGAGTSKANTAILHTGFDATPGSIESRLVARGYELLLGYATATSIAVERTGALLVAWDDEQAATLPALAAKAIANGYDKTTIVDTATVYELEPRLGRGACGGMVVPDEHLIDPWSTTVAFAREAIENGVTWLPNLHVTKLVVASEVTEVVMADASSLLTHYVVNAAGLRSDEVHRLIGLDGFTVHPRRGELIVFDKLARPLLGRTILPVPTSHTKGVLVAPTVFGNIMLGPTADDIDDKTATGSTRCGVGALLAKGSQILPELAHEEITAVYAGLRAATEHSDYQIGHERALRYVYLGGIRSTGLTASMAIAEEALSRLARCGLQARPRPRAALTRIRMTNLGEAEPRPYQRGGSGPIVCHCERVTRNEIVAACLATPPAVNLDGIRRRTRALAGRCQGFYCSTEICALAAETTGGAMTQWLGLGARAGTGAGAGVGVGVGAT